MTEYDIGNLINYCKSKEEKVNTTKEIIKLSKEHKVKVGAVYVIENTIFGKCYIGQTRNITKIFDNWKRDLENNSNRYPSELCYDYKDFKTAFQFYIYDADITMYGRTRKRENLLESEKFLDTYNLWKNKGEWIRYIRGK